MLVWRSGNYAAWGSRQALVLSFEVCFYFCPAFPWIPQEMYLLNRAPFSWANLREILFLPYNQMCLGYVKKQIYQHIEKNSLVRSPGIASPWCTAWHTFLSLPHLSIRWHYKSVPQGKTFSDPVNLFILSVSTPLVRDAISKQKYFQYCKLKKAENLAVWYKNNQKIQ